MQNIFLETRYIPNSSFRVYNVMAGEAERCNLHWLTALSGSRPDNEAHPLSAMKASSGQAREISSAQWAMIWTKLPWNQNPQMRSAIVGLRSAGVAWPGILVWHHSGPLKCPKKGWKPLKSAFLGTLKPPMLPKSIFFFNMHLLMSPESVSDVKSTI